MLTSWSSSCETKKILCSKTLSKIFSKNLHLVTLQLLLKWCYWGCILNSSWVPKDLKQILHFSMAKITSNLLKPISSVGTFLKILSRYVWPWNLANIKFIKCILSNAFKMLNLALYLLSTITYPLPIYNDFV